MLAVRTPAQPISLPPRHLLIPLVVLLIVGTALGEAQAQRDRSQGEWIAIRTPITSETVTRIKNETNRAIENRGARVLVYHFQFGGASDYGPCRDLAQFIWREIGGRAETYAYVDKPLRGHATLPALACLRLWVGQEGAIGDANFRQNQAIGKPEQIQYLEIAQARGKWPALVLKMLYADLVVYKVEGANGVSYKLHPDQVGRHEIDPRPEYCLTPEELNQNPVPIFKDGELGLFSPSDERCKTLNLWGRVYNSPQKVVEALGLPGSVIQGNPLLNLDQPPRVGLIEIKGNLDRGTVETARRQIHRALEKEKVNCLILQLDAVGGPSHVESADSLARDLQAMKDKVLTIAFIPSQANGAATFLAFGCSRIVMGPQATLGDCKTLVYNERGKPLDENLVETFRTALKSLAEKQGYPPVIVDALMNPDAEVVQVQAKPDPNQRDLPAPTFMLKSDAEQQHQKWNILKSVKGKNQLLTLDTGTALAAGIAWEKVEPPDLDNLARVEGFDPRTIVKIQTDWLDDLVNVLTHPVATVFLVIVGFTCLILEFKAPGMGLPAIMAAVCFVLVFWAHSWLAREVNSLAILLFLLGLVLLGVEIFILPGFGITGVSGIVLLLLSLALVVVQRWPQSEGEYVDLGMNASIFAAGLVVSLFAAYVLARYLPNIPYANRLVLQPPDEETSDAGAPLPPAHSPALLGAVGVAMTTLRPAGKARFGDEFVDVVAEGHYVEVGARVQVIEIDGVRVVVKPV